MAKYLSSSLILLLILSLLCPMTTAQAFSASEWRRLSGYPNYVWDVEFSPQGTYFALTVDDNTTELYNWDWERIWRYEGRCRDEHHHAGALAFSPDEQYLAIGAHGERNEIAILRLTDLRVIQYLKGHSEVRGLNREALSLEKYRGKVILLDFWATWCGPCLEEMPNVKRVYRQYKDQNFQIIGISLDTDRSSLRAYLQRERITWPQFFDGAGWDNSVAQQYGINGIPHTYLIDGNGFIRKENLRGRALEAAVAELVKENNQRKNSRKVRRGR